jgi:hypothetical protein
MTRTIKILCAMLVVGVMNCHAQSAVEPIHQPTAASDAEATGAVAGQPFSAIKYSRTVKVLPDGKQEYIRNKQYSIQIARGSNRRVLLLFEPQTRIMNHGAGVATNFVMC